MNVFLGVCEDNNSDPLKMGRIKVRIFGIHTEHRDSEEDNKQLKVEDLPWATPCFPIQSPSIDGLSDFQVPKNGSVVLVTFLDDHFQKPVYIGTIPKLPKELPDWSIGFSDKNKLHPASEYLNESPISRLARNEKISETIIQTKRDTIKTGISCANASWSEPPSHYSAEYTKNRVIETEKHIIELDDTEGSERIHIYHKSGSSLEYHQNGDLVDRTENSKYTIILNDDNILIEHNQNKHINADENETIGSSSTSSVGSNINRTAGGNITHTANNINHSASSNLADTASSTLSHRGRNISNIASTIISNKAGLLFSIKAKKISISGKKISLN